MDDTVKLLPCPNPWCASTTPPLPVKSTYADDAWRVRCACGVVTFRQDTKAEAITAWNTRAALSASPEDAEQSSQIAAMREALEEVVACMLNGGDGVQGDFGWNISRLTKARPMIRAALSTLGSQP